MTKLITCQVHFYGWHQVQNFQIGMTFDSGALTQPTIDWPRRSNYCYYYFGLRLVVTPTDFVDFVNQMQELTTDFKGLVSSIEPAADFVATAKTTIAQVVIVGFAVENYDLS